MPGGLTDHQGRMPREQRPENQILGNKYRVAAGKSEDPRTQLSQLSVELRTPRLHCQLLELAALINADNNLLACRTQLCQQPQKRGRR